MNDGCEERDNVTRALRNIYLDHQLVASASQAKGLGMKCRYIVDRSSRHKGVKSDPRMAN